MRPPSAASVAPSPSPSPESDRADACVGFPITATVEGLEMNQDLDPNGVGLVVLPARTEHDTTAETASNSESTELNEGVNRLAARKPPPERSQDIKSEKPKKKDMTTSVLSELVPESTLASLKHVGSKPAPARSYSADAGSKSLATATSTLKTVPLLNAVHEDTRE